MSEQEMGPRTVVSAEGLRQMEEKLKYLTTVRMAEVAEHLSIARGFGDLSENAEYDEAKDEQAKLQADIQELENALRNVVVIEGEVTGKGMTKHNVQYALNNDYQQPANFYGVGGLKIFRDLIFQMQGLMREDHRFYKKHGFYDFPQKRVGTILGMYLVGGMMNSKKLARKMGGSMTKGMLMPYRSIIEKARPAGSGKKVPIRKQS